MTALAEPITSPNPNGPPAESMGDLLQRLGGISPDRVRMYPTPGTATVADVVSIDAHEDRLFELIDGILVEKSMGFWESYFAGKILTALNIWVLPRNLGAVTGEAGMMRLFSNQVRMPDVAYVSWSRFPDGKPNKDPVPLLAPDIAVEVLSDSNTVAEMNRKRAEYFQSGTHLVWIVDGDARTITVYTAPEVSILLTENDTLDGGNVLPGFTLALKELFTKPGK